MAVTILNVQTELNTYLGDSSEDRVTNVQRLSYINQATTWAMETLENDHSVSTYDLNYYDTVHYYKISSVLADYLDSNDLRRQVGENYYSFTNKSSREMAEDVAQKSTESAFSIERRDGDAYLFINHDSKYRAMLVSGMNSLTADGGTWEADTTTSDATNLDIQSSDFTEGGSAFTFDIDVSQSVNNRATIINSSFTTGDLTDDRDITSWLLDFKPTTITNITSVTFYWGSSSSDYFSVTQTTDMNSNAFITDWNTLEFEWAGAIVTGSPDVENIDYFRIDINYSSGQTDATSFKLDNLRLVRPEKLKFYYTSWTLGTNSGGTNLTKYTATTDIPYYSGQYDNYIYPIAQYAAALCFRDLRLYNEADKKEIEALKSIDRIRKIVPSSVVRETKNFKLKGINFNRYRRTFR